MRPNLFTYATKELSQDAFFCWLFEHVKYAQSGCEQTIAIRLLNTIWEKFTKLNPSASFTPEPWEQLKLAINTQVHKIDILLTFESQVTGDKFFIVIEDKTHSGEHRDKQVEYYVEKIRRDNPGSVIIPVFLKTGYIPAIKLEELTQRKLVTILHSDIEKAFSGHVDPKQEIIQSWWTNFQAAYYNPIMNAQKIDLNQSLAGLYKEQFNKLAKEILFDRIAAHVFKDLDDGFVVERNVENAKARVLYEYVVYKPDWIQSTYKIGLYLTWSNELTLDIKTIPLPYVSQEKMSRETLDQYIMNRQSIKESLSLPEGWSFANTHLQIAKNTDKLGSLPVDQFKDRVLLDYQKLSEQIDKSVLRITPNPII
ncbi:MAG: hypothetical protein K0S39_317 [Paenibacillus sp.]|jgi:hypothetical protein|nr:hypothetical protein [Paenibacillus sp.]